MRILTTLRALGLCALTLLCCADVLAMPTTAPLIVLDPGHNPKQPGALGARGKYEVDYNDAFCKDLAETLRRAGFRVLLTRQPGQTISLEERALLAEHAHGDVFLAIHHDSAQLIYLDKADYFGSPAMKTREPLSGYSIFVSTTNPRHAQSRRLAQLLGMAFHELGRAPSHHHAEKIDGENREPLDSELGIYRFDDLVVLKKNAIPAVLIELGVIVDEADERYVSDPANQIRMQQAIVKALRDYFETVPVTDHQ